MSELLDAIKAGDGARIDTLIEQDPSLLTRAENDVTPVLLAVYHGQREIARHLVQLGAPLSFPEACAIGESARVKTMFEADPTLLHTKSADGFPAIGLAIFFGHGGLAQWMIDNGADVNAIATNAARVAPVHAAAAVSDRETMRMLLERGANPNAKQQNDVTPLHGAASRGDVEMATLLLAHGAEPGARTTDGLTPVEMARKYGKTEFADWMEDWLAEG